MSFQRDCPFSGYTVVDWIWVAAKYTQLLRCIAGEWSLLVGTFGGGLRNLCLGVGESAFQPSSKEGSIVGWCVEICS